MPRGVTFETVRTMALGLPGVEEGSTYGRPSFKVGGRLMACRAINKSAEPDSLMVVVDVRDRDEMMAGEPDVYYTTPHYEGGCVLVRMRRVHVDALRDLLAMSRQYVAAKVARRRRSSARASATQ